MKWDIKAQDREAISDEAETSSFSSAEYLLSLTAYYLINSRITIRNAEN